MFFSTKIQPKWALYERYKHLCLQPGYRSFVNKKCADPPNLRTTHRLTKSLTAQTFQAVSTAYVVVL